MARIVAGICNFRSLYTCILVSSTKPEYSNASERKKDQRGSAASRPFRAQIIFQHNACTMGKCTDGKGKSSYFEAKKNFFLVSSKDVFLLQE